jgi:short-subunit dehydrogenase
MTCEGKVCVVTGASSGIGRAFALECLRRGARVWGLGRSAERLASLVNDTRGLPGALTAVSVDLRDEDEIRSAVATILSQVESVDVLIHSAGSISRGPVEQAGVGELDGQYLVNLRAPFLLTRTFLPALKEARGQIVFINSTAGRVAAPDAALYAATKHALSGFADSLRQEVNIDGVRVLTVFLGRTATPMQEAVHEHEGRRYEPELLMAPEDVVELLLAVLSAERTLEVTDLVLRPLTKLTEVER